MDRDDFINELVRNFGLDTEDAEEIINNMTRLNVNQLDNPDIRAEGEFLSVSEAYNYLIELTDRFGLPQYELHLEYRIFRSGKTREYEFFVVWTPSP